MRFSQFTVVLAAAAPALAQVNPLGNLPSDLQAYVNSVETNPAVVAAVEQLAAATPIQDLLNAVNQGDVKSLDPEAFVQSLEAAANAAISAAPSDQQAVAKSVIGVVESLAATDNLVGVLSSEFTLTGTVAPTSAPTSGASTAAKSTASVASAPVTTPNAAAQPTGMALGAFVGAVAVVAAVL